MIQSGFFNTSLPITASHEGAGTVVAAGSTASHWVGSRVMCGQQFHACGRCADCTSPNEGWRLYWWVLLLVTCSWNLHRKADEGVSAYGEGKCGVHRDGFFAEYALCDARSSTILPRVVRFLNAAALACTGRTVWRAIEQTGLEAGQWIALVGSGGGLGHLGVQFAKQRGLKVVGIDARDDMLVVTREMGADVVVDAREGRVAVVNKVHEVTGSAKGVDATVNLSDAREAAALACAVTRMHGEVVQVAQPGEVVVPFMEFAFRDVRVTGSVIASPEESRRMVEHISRNGLSPGVHSVVLEGLDMVNIEELLRLVHTGIPGKAIILVDRDQLEGEELREFGPNNHWGMTDRG